MITDLTTPIAAGDRLDVGLQRLIEWNEKKHQVAIHLHLDGTPPPPDVTRDSVLFEAVRELLLNVVKHAEVPSADVYLTTRRDRLEIIVADQGKGFDPAMLGTGGTGLGLRTLRQRIEQIGGMLDIQSAPGQGSRFTLTVPLPPT